MLHFFGKHCSNYYRYLKAKFEGGLAYRVDDS